MKILLEEKILVTHSKKSSRYYWILETVTGKTVTTTEEAEFLNEVLKSDIFKILKRSFSKK